MKTDKIAILCVDDEDFVLSSIKRQLKRHFGNAYQIEVAQDGHEALEIIRELVEENVDLAVVISDYIMPTMKGDELLQLVHQITPRTVTILLTGQANMDGITNAVNYANLYRYIAKPWEQTDLILTVTEALHSYQQESLLIKRNEELQQANQKLEYLNTHLELEVAARISELREAYCHLKKLHNRLEHDLSLARKIQRGLLPSAVVQWDDLNVECYTIAAREVGGDFYTYHHVQRANAPLLLSEKCTPYILAIGDISGKGMPAALLMSMCLVLFQSIINSSYAPATFLTSFDQAIAPYTRATNMNCALCYVEISFDREEQLFRLRVANAGCIPPFIRRRDGTVVSLDVYGLPLGIDVQERLDYPEIEVSLSEGDTIILTSDGVVEAMNGDKKIFGFERLERAIACAPDMHAPEIIAYLVREITQFMDGCDLSDDMTIVVANIGSVQAQSV